MSRAAARSGSTLCLRVLPQAFEQGRLRGFQTARENLQESCRAELLQATNHIAGEYQLSVAQMNLAEARFQSAQGAIADQEQNNQMILHIAEEREYGITEEARQQASDAIHQSQ